MQLNNDVVMANIEDYREEVYKCSKCGLCKSVCPVFLATKNEMHLPRGRYIVLNRFYNGQEKLTKNFIKDLDLCLNCNLCKEFCPSGIDSAEIFTVFKNCFKYKYSIFNFSSVYKIRLFLNSIFHLKYKIQSDKKAYIAFFEGCQNKYIDNTDEKDCIELLKQTGIDKIKIVSGCCGYPYLCEGNLTQFDKNTKHIISKIKNSNLVICSCDTCFNILEKIIKDNNLTCKIITIDSYLNKNKLNSGKDFLYFKPLLRKFDPPYKAITINKKNMCSLMENFLLLKHRKIAYKILNNIKNDLLKYDDKTIVTTCQITKNGLNKIFKNLKMKTRAVSYASYMKKVSNKKSID